jgi:hypothetical protein
MFVMQRPADDLGWLLCVAGSEFVEHEEGSADEAAEGYGVVPVETLSEVVNREDAEHAEGDDLLNHLELRWREGGRAEPVCWYLETVLEEGDAPADKDDLPECDIFVLEVSVPGDGHEDV